MKRAIHTTLEKDTLDYLNRLGIENTEPLNAVIERITKHYRATCTFNPLN